MKVDLTPKLRIKQSNPDRPITIERDGQDWIMRVDYPASNDIAGTYVVLSVDGSAKRMTIDQEGNVIDEFNLNLKKEPKT